MLDPRRLVVLREFVAQGTIARAADALSFTPSAVSQQLSQLQRESGVALFRRAGRRLELTDAGRTLAARADELLARLEEVEAELARAAGDMRGTVRVAAFQTAARALVLPAIDRLTGTHPGLRIELVELEAEESLPLAARGAVELAIAEEYEHAPRPHVAGLERAYLEPDEMVLALPAATRRQQTTRCRSRRCATSPGRPGTRGPPTRTWSRGSAAPSAALSPMSATA